MPDPQIDQPRFCSRCGQPIVVADAQFCKDCGAPIAATQIFVHAPGFNPITAFVLSVIPGLGQIYKGHVIRGVIWFCAVLIAYQLGAIGPILHFVCALNAAFQGTLRDDRAGGSRVGRRGRGPRVTAAPSDTWRY
ncbi:MAG: NADH pyrophosphatase zinc ribbon domain-containing protein [Candidatus Binataceae bacterium]